MSVLMASLPRALLVIAVRFSLSDMDILQWLGAHIILSFIGSSVRLEPGSFLLVFLEKTRNCFRWNPFVLNFHYEMEAEMLRLIQYFLLLLFYDSRHSGFSIVWGSILLNIFLQYCYGRNLGENSLKFHRQGGPRSKDPFCPKIFFNFDD